MRVAFTKGNFSPNQNKSGFSTPSASVFAPENTEQETAEGKAGWRGQVGNAFSRTAGRKPGAGAAPPPRLRLGPALRSRSAAPAITQRHAEGSALGFAGDRAPDARRTLRCAWVADCEA